MLLGEYDYLFIKPAEQVAREVPNCRHVVLEGMGHMTALENPQRLGDELLSFLKEGLNKSIEQHLANRKLLILLNRMLRLRD